MKITLRVSNGLNREMYVTSKRGLEIFRAIVYNGNMKDKLPRKYKIISRVGKAECAHHNGVRNVGRLYQAYNDNRRRVRRSDAPENLVFPRYVGMHNDDADMGETAETLVLSGFSGGGGAPI